MTNIAGIYEIKIKRIAFDTGIDKEMVSKIFERFEREDKIIYNNEYIIFRNWTKHQTINESVKAGIERIYEEVSKEITNIALTRWGTRWGLAVLLNLTIPNLIESNSTLLKPKRRKSPPTLFVNSDVALFDVFKDEFYSNAKYMKFDAEYYFEAVKNWSDEKGATRIDWIATARKFAMKDADSAL